MAKQKGVATYVEGALKGKVFRDKKGDYSYRIEGIHPGFGPSIATDSTVVWAGKRSLSPFL